VYYASQSTLVTKKFAKNLKKVFDNGLEYGIIATILVGIVGNR
jgi:hypothetical protein